MYTCPMPIMTKIFEHYIEIFFYKEEGTARDYNLDGNTYCRIFKLSVEAPDSEQRHLFGQRLLDKFGPVYKAVYRGITGVLPAWGSWNGGHADLNTKTQAVFIDRADLITSFQEAFERRLAEASLEVRTAR